MSQYSRKPITVDAIQLMYPTTINKSTTSGAAQIEKGIAGDYLVVLNNEQFIIPKAQFELTYEIQSLPDTIAPTEVANFTIDTVTDALITIAFDTPSDSDFKAFIVELDGVEVIRQNTIGHITYTTGTLTPNTTYLIGVKTLDKAGNISNGVSQSVTTLTVAP